MKRDLVDLFNKPTERMPFDPVQEQCGSLAFHENQALKKKVNMFFIRWQMKLAVTCIKCSKKFKRLDDVEDRPLCPHCGTRYRKPGGVR